MKTRLAVIAAIAGPIVVVAAAPAVAAPTESATLNCGESGEFEVTGFGRGQALKVVDSTSNFVVTFAQLENGSVVFDNPGQRNAGDVVTCTTTAPSGRSFTFRGFFTPRG